MPLEYALGRSNDARPNSGLREGDILHAEVNEAIGRLHKTIIFGQYSIF
jgi:hypothetical protein